MFDDKLVQFIHEPARLILLTHLVSMKKADFAFLLNCTNLSRGNLSVQMTRLEEKGLVAIEKMFKDNRPCTMYQITRSGRNALKRYKKAMLDLLAGLNP